MDFHLKGIAIGIVFLLFQLISYKKIKNKVIRLVPLFIALLCLFFCYLLYLGFPPIETTPFSSNEFTGALAMVWCGYGIIGALLGSIFANSRRIFNKTKTKLNIKNLKKIRPANKKLIIIIVVLILVEATAFRCYLGTLNPYISDLNIVYTPTKPAYKFYHWYWIDIYDYYVFRLSNREEKIIIQEAENGKWSELTSYHINELDYYEYCDEFLDYSYRYHKCYICIYDEQNNQIVTDSDNDIPANRIIFLYDTETNKYYCVFETM